MEYTKEEIINEHNEIEAERSREAENNESLIIFREAEAEPKEVYCLYVLDNYESLTNDVYNDVGYFKTYAEAEAEAKKNYFDDDYRIIKENE